MAIVNCSLKNLAAVNMYRALITNGYHHMEKSVTMDNINQNVRDMEYAIRGEIPIRANEMAKELSKKQGNWPFREITKANIGNPHEMKQKPITFVRQVLACCVDPSLIQESFYPEDVKERAREYLDDIEGGSIGAYTHSLGMPKVRQQVADFITNRDGWPSSPSDVILVNGASDGIIGILNLIISPTMQGRDRAGIMIPIPQYPLYTATISRLGAEEIPYYLDPDENWCLDVEQMRQTIREARKTCTPRVLVTMNPGNPTGQCLPESNIRSVIEFCKEEKLMLLADEVYQENVYDSHCKFHSFKKVLRDMGEDLELVSCHSISKGYLGECGIRGGYLEIVGFDPEVKAVLEKYFSAKLCSSTPGQILCGLMVNPPKKGEPSYEKFAAEKEVILGSLMYKARTVSDKMATIPGIRCNPVQGAMYAYPMVTVPEGARKAAELSDLKLDVFYCLKLLEETGIVFVPGSGFGTDVTNTFHFRMTILPDSDRLDAMIEDLRRFHMNFCKQYSA